MVNFPSKTFPLVYKVYYFHSLMKKTSKSQPFWEKKDLLLQFSYFF